jgi:hypothetical protein
MAASQDETSTSANDNPHLPSSSSSLPSSSLDDKRSQPDEEASAIPSVLLDVHTLDQYLLQLLLPFLKAACPIKTTERYLLPTLQCLTILFTSGQTPAARLLGLKLTTRTSSSSTSKNTLDDQERLQERVWWYAIIGIVIPTFYQSFSIWWRNTRHDQEVVEDTSTEFVLNEQERLARARQERTLKLLFAAVDSIVPMLRLGLLLGCWTGKCKSPSLAMVLTGLSYRQSTPPPALHVDHAHRRWMYFELMQTIRIVFGGCTMLHVWRPLLQSVLDKVRMRRDSNNNSNNGDGSNNEQEESCPICRGPNIVIPVETNCGHVYCYTCLNSFMRQQARPACRTCGRIIVRTKTHRPNET